MRRGQGRRGVWRVRIGIRERHVAIARGPRSGGGRVRILHQSEEWPRRPAQLACKAECRGVAVGRIVGREELEALEASGW